MKKLNNEIGLRLLEEENIILHRCKLIFSPSSSCVYIQRHIAEVFHHDGNGALLGWMKLITEDGQKEMLAVSLIS